MNVNFERYSKPVRYAATSISEALRKKCSSARLKLGRLLLIVGLISRTSFKEVVRTFECKESRR